MPYSNSQAYQWVLFDADETLFQFDAPRGLKLMFSRQGVDFSDATMPSISKPMRRCGCLPGRQD